jgi:hypothetical protein
VASDTKEPSIRETLKAMGKAFGQQERSIMDSGLILKEAAMARTSLPLDLSIREVGKITFNME